MSRIAFASFSVVAPSGWDDITDTVECDDPPYTLAQCDGVGALQFTLALYARGRAPNPSPDDLLEMLASFGKSNRFGCPADVVLESAPLRLAAGSFANGVDFVRAWQVCDGRNFAFITYTCESGHQDRELAVCEGIVRSLKFSRTGNVA